LRAARASDTAEVAVRSRHLALRAESNGIGDGVADTFLQVTAALLAVTFVRLRVFAISRICACQSAGIRNLFVSFPQASRKVV
jgi:hypothetical protein